MRTLLRVNNTAVILLRASDRRPPAINAALLYPNAQLDCNTLYILPEALDNRKPPPTQLIPQHSYNGPYPTVMKIRLKFLDPDLDPDQHQQPMLYCQTSHSSKKFIKIRPHNFLSYPADRQTDRHTQRQRHNLRGGGKMQVDYYACPLGEGIKRWRASDVCLTSDV